MSPGVGEVGACRACGTVAELGHDLLCASCRARSSWPLTTGQPSGRSTEEWEAHLLKLSQKASPHLWPEEAAELAAMLAHLRALAAQADAGAGGEGREKPTHAELDAVRGYLIDVRAGPHTVGSVRYFARRFEGCDPSDIPESWETLPDQWHVTKAMHAEVLWRAFRRAASAQASAGGEG